MQIYKITCLIALALCQHVSAIKVLGIISLPLRSHYTAFQALFRELAVRGHDVTVMNNFPDEKPLNNLRFINLKGKSYNETSATKHPLSSYEHIDSNFNRYRNVYEIVLSKIIQDDCECLFTNENVKNHYKEGHQYDVIFVEQFIGDCELAYAAAMYDAPIIGITSHTLLPWSYARMELPFNIATDAFYFSNVGRNPPLYNKVETVFLQFILSTIGRWNMQKGVYSAFNKYLPEYSLDIERVARERMKMMFVYQHFSITGARVLAPQVVEIAGIHVGTPKPVPPEIEKFLSDAKHGAIYVSFGSNLKASTMSEGKLQEFLTAFRRLPYKIIWKHENATFSEENLYTGTWLPQLDILCHPKVLAFVSHGGMLSLSEATHCGKPLVTIPFFGDQFSNSAAMRDIGVGRTLFFDRLNADNLEAAIRELTTPEVQQNAQRISRLWHDRPMPVMDSAIYWTEYVARHKSAPPSLPAQHSTWFEGLLIDVAIVIIVIVLLIGLVVYSALKLLKFILLKFLSLFRRKKVKGE